MAEFDGRASTRKPKVIEIEAEGKHLKFVLKSIGAYEADQITGKYMTINTLTGRGQFDATKLADYHFEILRKVLVEAPFELTDQNIKDLDPEIALEITNALGVGPVALERRKKLSQQ